MNIHKGIEIINNYLLTIIENNVLQNPLYFLGLLNLNCEIQYETTQRRKKENEYFSV